MYSSETKLSSYLKEDLSRRKEVMVNPRSRLATFSLLLLFAAFFVFRPLSATDERAAGRPLAEWLPAHNSEKLQQAAQPGQTADLQSPTDESSPLFPVREHGKMGYMDKTGKVAIPPQYHVALPFFDGLAQVWADVGGRKLGYIDKAGHAIIPFFYTFTETSEIDPVSVHVGVPWRPGFRTQPVR